MKNNPNMISTDTHQQFNRALKPAIMKQFPDPVLNNTTIAQLGAGEDSIEVFPPEIFFKGKNALSNGFRHRAKLKLRSHCDGAQPNEEHEAHQVQQAKDLGVPLPL